MKIGFDARVLMDKKYSGVSEYTANLLSAILEIDKENQYKLFYNSFRSQNDKLKPWVKENTKLIGSRYPNKIFNYILQKIFSYPKIDKYLGDIDVFFSPHFNFLNISKGCKSVITVHDISFLRYPEFFSLRKNIWHKSLGIKKMLNKFDKIVAVSENTKLDLVEVLDLEEDKIHVIYSGNKISIDKEIENSEVEEYLNKKDISSDYIFYLGNIEPRKNIVSIIEAYNKIREKREDLKNTKLVIAGASGWKNKCVFTAWEKSKYKKDIKFLGYVNKREKEILYRKAKLFVYPSFYEGFGFPPLEAMKRGVPVISSNVSSLPEILKDAAILVNPYRVDEIEQAMLLCLTDEDLRNNLIEKGKKREKEFSWHNTAISYLKLFNELNER